MWMWNKPMPMIRACIVLLLFRITDSVVPPNPGGCNQSPTTLIGGVNKLSNNIPVLQAATYTFQPVLGGHKINGWTMFGATDLLLHGLWCQVNSLVSFTILPGSAIANWYLTTGFDTLELVPTVRPPTIPYELYKCTNQTGVVVNSDIDFSNYQGIVKCNTTARMLATPKDIYFTVYSDSVFKSYPGPNVEPNMTLDVISERDSELVDFTISFNVTFGLPSRVICSDLLERRILLDSREAPNLSREVIQTHYFNSSVADTTLVTVSLSNVEKREQSYVCNATIEGYPNGTSADLVVMGSGLSTINISVASAPVNVTVTQQQINLTHVLVTMIWSAPKHPPSSYEVFYQSQNDHQLTSGGIVQSLQITLTGLRRGELYTFYVVGFEEFENVFPSNHSSVVSMLISAPTNSSSTVATPSINEITTVVQLAAVPTAPTQSVVQNTLNIQNGVSTIQNGVSSTVQNMFLTMTTLPVATDVLPTEPVFLLAMLIVIGWSLFFIAFLFSAAMIVTLIVCFCVRRNKKKSMPVNATTPIKPDEELYDSIDQLAEEVGKHNMEMTGSDTNSTGKQGGDNNIDTTAVNVQKSHTNASEGKAVVYNDDITEQLPSVYDTVDQDIKMTECDAYTAVSVEGDKNSHTHDEDITMMGCDAYDVTSAGDSKNHQVTHAHNEDDIAMTECDAYGSNHQPQSDYDDVINNKPSNKQQPQSTDYDDLSDYV